MDTPIVTPKEMDLDRRLWAPYLVSEPDPEGNIEAHCPVHPDRNPSARVNLGKDVWYCHSCGQGGPLMQVQDMLIARDLGGAEGESEDPEGFVPLWVAEGNGGGRRRIVRDREALPTPVQVERWHGLLMDDPASIAYLTDRRGLTLEEVKQRRIGLRLDAFTIPVFDVAGKLTNVRYYQPAERSPDGKKRIWQERGATASLYPVEVLALHDLVVVVEGEWDALLLNSRGVPAITTTGGTGRWGHEWVQQFAGKRVLVVPDRDGPGTEYGRRLADSLAGVAAHVGVVELPYPVETAHGKDVTDYLVGDGHTVEDLRQLMADASPATGPAESSSEVDVDDDRVRRELQNLRVRDLAQRLFRAEQAVDRWPGDEGSLADLLREDLPPTPYTIQRLHQRGHNTLLRAAFKTGKSTLLANVMRSLVDGEPFLGELDVEAPDGNVAYFNYELTKAQAQGWFRDLDIRTADRVFPVHLRGVGLDLLNDGVAEQVIEWLQRREVASWLIDPFFRAARLEDENSNSEVGLWLDRLDEVKTAAGVVDLYLATHSGRQGDHARGASRIEDWADNLWRLTKDSTSRWFAADAGRDTGLDKARLTFDEATRRLTIAAGSSATDKLDARVAVVVKALASAPLNRTDLQNTLTFDKNDHGPAINEAKARGFVEATKDGRATLHHLTEEGRAWLDAT